MSIKCFCDSCGKEINKPIKNITITIANTPYFPDLCEECKEKIIELIYKHSGVLYYDDKK